MFKAYVLSSFVLATLLVVDNGYKALLAALDHYVDISYGELARSDNPDLQEAGQSITHNYYSYRQSH